MSHNEQAGKHYAPDGLEREFDLLVGQLAEPACRLVTLVGHAGRRKTALARRVARHFLSTASPAPDPFPDGVYLIKPRKSRQHGLSNDLAPDSQTLGDALGAVLGVASKKIGDSFSPLLDALRDRAMLLVLDDFEPSEGDTLLVEALLRQAPRVTVLALVQASLDLQEEWLLEIESA